MLNMTTTTPLETTTISTSFSTVNLTKKEVLKDYEICCVSRQMSLAARRDVLTGKAMFCTTDDGKELLQVAMAKAFKKGDFRSGYYRGHTLMLALGLHQPEDFFAHLYADSNNDPSSGGRSTMNHHATPLIDEKGHWLQHTEHYNIASDISSTAAQMARALGYTTYINDGTNISGDLESDLAEANKPAANYYSNHGILKGNTQTASLVGLSDVLSIEPAKATTCSKSALF